MSRANSEIIRAWADGSDIQYQQGGKWIDAFVKGPDGFEIALQRRGTRWRFGVASLGRILYPGDVEKTNAEP